MFRHNFVRAFSLPLMPNGHMLDLDPMPGNMRLSPAMTRHRRDMRAESRWRHHAGFCALTLHAHTLADYKQRRKRVLPPGRPRAKREALIGGPGRPIIACE